MENHEKSRQQLSEEVSKLRRQVTELRATSAKLRRAKSPANSDQEPKFHALAEITSAAIFIYQGRRNRYVNPATEAITGYAEEELLAMNFWDIVHPDFRDLVKTQGMARQRGEAVPARYEIKIVTKGGEDRWLDFTGGLIEFEGQPAVIGTAFDITERKLGEQEIEQLYNQVRRELVRRQQVEREIIQHNAELLTLQYTAATLASSLDLSIILDTFGHELTTFLTVTGCLICQWDRAMDAIRVIARYGLAHWKDEWPVIYPLATLDVSRRVLIERRAFQFTLNQADAGPLEVAYMQAIKVKSLLMLPMEFQGQVVGLIEVMDDHLERVFTNQEIAMAQMMANQAASAVQNAQLYAEVKRQLEERTKAEADLLQSETRQRALLDAIPDLMFRLTRTGQFLDYRCGNELSSMWPAQVETGQNLAEVFPAEIVGLILERLDQVLASGVPQTFEFRRSLLYYTQDYEARLVVSGADEVLGIVRNITERKQMEEQAMHSVRLAALGQLSAALTHEINNPLQSMQSHLDLLLDFSLEPGEDKKFLQVIRQEVERLNEITRRVLNLTRPWPMLRRKIFVTDLLQEVLLLVGKQLDQNNIELITEWQDVAPVLAVPDQLTQVFLNLILNANEATPSGGQLQITVQSLPNQVTVSIINSGSTIAPDILPYIFEPFFTTKCDGSGLGLWVSHNLVRQHGGSISVDNLRSNEGVAFTVTLPTLSEMEVIDDNAGLSTK